MEINKNTKLILLHGWGGSIQSLEKLSIELELHGYTSVLLEIPGHGSTPEMSEPWRMNNFADWLQSEIIKRNIHDYVLIGHSFGGKIILEALLARKVSPKAVCLIDISGIKPAYSVKVHIAKLTSKLIRPLFSLPLLSQLRYYIYRYLLRETDYVETSSNVRESFKLFIEEHYDDTLYKIDTNTLLIWGRNDTITPLWMGEKIHTLLQHSELKVIEGTHGIALQKSKQVATLIITYLNK